MRRTSARRAVPRDMAISADAPAVTRQERVVPATPAQVFALLADVEAWPTWQPDVTRVRTSGTLAVGTEFRWHSGVRVTSRVTHLRPGRAIAWTGRAVGTRAIHTWTLEEDPGGTLVRTEESMDGWLPRMLTSTVQRTLERGVSQVLEALEEAVRR